MKELWLFTTRFPYGLRESFLENELPILCARYDRVLVFPEHTEDGLRTLPPNAELQVPVKDPYGSASIGEMIKSTPLVVKLILSLLRDAPSFKILRAQWPDLRSRIGQLIRRSLVLRQRIEKDYDPERVTLYTYWTHDWTTVLGLVQHKVPKLNYFSRAHGFDVFEAQNLNGWIPFRSFQLRHVSKVYCASRSGMEHLRRRHPERKDLFELAQLGTRDHGVGPFDPTGPLRVVSCSFLIPRKRVLLLVEALSAVDVPVEWTHFGGGTEEATVHEAASRLPAHVKVDLKGMTPNPVIMDWYRSHPVDVFIHLSHLEGGVVVAVQEAASFGIPVIATDSGGIREIMGERTGILLQNDPSTLRIAELLNGWRKGPMATEAFRTGVRQAWKEQFDANVVFHRFVDRISNG